MHQIIYEVCAQYVTNPVTNFHESHGLYYLVHNCPPGTPAEPTHILTVALVAGDSHAEPQTLYLNKDLAWLSVTARGAFNFHINAVVSSLLTSVGWATKPLYQDSGLVSSAQRLLHDSTQHYVDQEAFKKYMETFVWGSTEAISASLAELTRDLLFSGLRNSKESLEFIEKLLVGLLGHNKKDVRDLAVVHLNVFYDDTDWQLLEPFVPKVTTCRKVFTIVEMIEELSDVSKVVFELHAPGFHPTSKNYLISYHLPQIKQTKRGCILKVDLGEFQRCGFYDWRFSQVKAGALCPLMKVGADDQLKPVQGRFIVHPADTQDLQIHEVFIDFQGAEFDIKTGVMKQRGNFARVQKNLTDRIASGINCLYLMGSLERDNGRGCKNPNASPLAITCRATACAMLGGDSELKSLVADAQKTGMKILVDCVARIASKNYHRKYKNKLLFTRNAEGLPVVYYGSDGRAIRYVESAMLNYRMAEVWNLLVQDVLEFHSRYPVDGIHIDNAQAWPQIMELDEEEMYKTDTDGTPHYTTQEIFEGIIVARNEFYGYWTSEHRSKYANPLFLKLCKELWRYIPTFYIVADVWHGSGMEDRDACIARSGPVPRLYDLPVKLSAVFGKRLHKDGHIEEIERKDVSVMKEWVESSAKRMPSGALIVQSSTGHSLPYPALLYGRGAWAAVDVLFFMDSIPMSFIGEQAGHAYRSRIPSLYDFQHPPNSSIPSIVSATNLLEVEEQHLPSVPRVNSTSSLTQISDMQELIQKEERFQEEIGPEYGFDLCKIRLHYHHRRRLRHEKAVLRYGELVPLVMRHDHGWHKHVLAFARCLPDEVALIVVNLNDAVVTGYLDLSRLESKLLDDKAIIYSMSEWFSQKDEEFYFREEVFKDRHVLSLLPFRSDVRSLVKSDVATTVAFDHSLSRLRNRMSEHQPIDGCYLLQRLLKHLNKEPLAESFNEVVNALGMLHASVIKPFSLDPLHLIRSIHSLDRVKRGKLLGVCDALLYKTATVSKNDPAQFAEQLVSANTLGPLVFTCPELGRFSTAGGLGVMVDELSQGIAALGQEVWAISPYYEKNKRGESSYLTNDPANVNWVFNIDVQIGNERQTFGVHRGYEHGVHLLFLHNSALLPHVYPDGRGAWVVKQLVGWGKGVLEALCRLGVIPSIMITNDWFTSMVPAYARLGAFGDTFKGTTFLHIVHNLDPSYEGRQYPSPAENGYANIHGLPNHLFIDPYWVRAVFNPSRCALLVSDQWATVSPSYREELLRHSPLKELLKSKPQPFAFPNGIPVEQRLRRFEHFGSHLNAKKLIQQKYFHYGDLDNSCALLSFVGRITEQKGVSLILDIAEQLIHQSNFKIQLLVGGPASYSDKYSAGCAHRMKDLRNRYPQNFYADPDNFFTDGPLVNLGSDFGLMPSMFEPGGIVQHEFFVAGTPVVAFKTGGLRDTVLEWNGNSETGCGFVFESYNANDFTWAINRGLHVFFHGNYNKLRKQAFNNVMRGETVTRAWLAEFYRLHNKLYFEFNTRQSTFESLKDLPWELHDYRQSLPENTAVVPKITRSPSAILLEQASSAIDDLKRSVLFSYTNQHYRPKTVQLTGSFDKWQIRHPLVFDHIKNFWHVALRLTPGAYTYKFVLDGTTWVVSEDHPAEKDGSGNLNNKIEVK